MFGLDLHPPEQGRGVTEPCMLCITIQGITVTTDSDFRLFFFVRKKDNTSVAHKSYLFIIFNGINPALSSIVF